MTGKIIKGISGFYYVHVVESGIYECKAKGVFRNQNIKPLVGDDVEIDVIDEETKKGNIVSIKERSNQLLRPAVSNVDQAVVIFAAAKPSPNLNLLDRFLLFMEKEQVPTIICFNKSDLASDEWKEELRTTYENSGYKVIFTSAALEYGLEELRQVLDGKVSTVAGPSGVGKSSLINRLQTDISMETGEISKKIERGKHTTRHSQLIPIKADTYIMDTPGFSTLYLENFEKEDLKEFYNEFQEYYSECRFMGCNHISEPDCAVKQAVADGKIAKSRYENYKILFEELSLVKKY